MHNSLFQTGRSRSEIYKSVCDDQKRDIRKFQIFTFIAGGKAGYAAFQGISDGWAWLILALLPAFQALIYFIDASNRTFFLHTLDWQDNERSFPGELGRGEKA